MREPTVGGLDALHKFSVAVVHHDDEILPDAFYKSDRLPDFLHGKGRAGLIALGTLNRDEAGVGLDGFADLLEIKGAVRF